MSRRTERLGSIIQQELAQIILHELADPRLQGFPSITRVKVSPDLSAADIYVTVMGTKGQQTAALNALQHSAGLMRSRLTRAVALRQAPFLKFHLDEGAKKEIELLDLIRKAAEETAEFDRRRAEAEGAAPPLDDQMSAATGAIDIPRFPVHRETVGVRVLSLIEQRLTIRKSPHPLPAYRERGPKITLATPVILHMKRMGRGNKR